MKSDIERLIQCIICGKDPETCGASEKDEDNEGLCLKYKPRTKYFKCEGICEECEAQTAIECLERRENGYIR